MNGGMTVEFDVHFDRKARGRKRMLAGQPSSEAQSPGTIPRVARLMALAIRCEDLIRHGEVADYAELARLGHVTRARMTQIMNLLNLAPDIQEALLFLQPTTRGRDPIGERDVRVLAAQLDWRQQRMALEEVRAKACPATKERPD